MGWLCPERRTESQNTALKLAVPKSHLLQHLKNGTNVPPIRETVPTWLRNARVGSRCLVSEGKPLGVENALSLMLGIPWCGLRGQPVDPPVKRF